MYTSEGLSSSLDLLAGRDGWASAGCLTGALSVLDFPKRGTDLPQAVRDMGLEEAGFSDRRCPSPQGRRVFGTPRNSCHKSDYQNELSRRANANKNFLHFVLFILLWTYLILGIIYHMYGL